MNNHKINEILLSLGMFSGLIWRAFIVVMGMYYIGIYNKLDSLGNILIGLAGVIWIMKELVEDSYRLYELAMDEEATKNDN